VRRFVADVSARSLRHYATLPDCDLDSASQTMNPQRTWTKSSIFQE
jgi:hypothetical protein